jgi:hypothetical protein
MKIRYQIGLKDLAAFAQYHQEHEPEARRVSRMFWGLIALFVLAGAASDALRGSLSLLPWAIIFSVIFLIIFRLLRRTLPARWAKRAYGDGSSTGAFGQHELELREDKLIERTDVGEAWNTLSSIHGIASTQNHTFIFLTSVSGHIVPRDAITEGDYDTFIRALKERCEAIQMGGERDAP